MRADPLALKMWESQQATIALGERRDLVDVVLKYGGATLPNGTWADVWDGVGLTEAEDSYPWPATGTAPITHVVCSNAADSGKTIGYRILDIAGEEIETIIELQGQTPVALPTPAWRFQRAYLDPGEPDIVGKIYFCNGAVSAGVPTDPTKVWGVLNDGNNNTLHGMYTIPVDRVGLGFRWWARLGRGATTVTQELEWRIRLAGGGGFRIVDNGAIVSAGSSVFDRDMSPFGLRLPPLTDIKVMAKASANGSSVSAGFDVAMFRLAE